MDPVVRLLEIRASVVGAGHVVPDCGSSEGIVLGKMSGQALTILQTEEVLETRHLRPPVLAGLHPEATFHWLPKACSRHSALRTSGFASSRQPPSW